MIQYVNDLFPEAQSSFGRTNEEPQILLTKLHGHVKSVQSLTQASPNYIWSLDSLGKLIIYEADEMVILKEIDTSKRNSFGVKKIGDSMWMVSPEGIQLRDPTSGELIKEIPGFTSSLAEFGGQIWCGGENLKILNPTDHSVIKETTLGQNSLLFNIVEVNGKLWISCSDNTIKIWDGATFEQVSVLTSHKKRVNKIIQVEDKVWSCSDDKLICIWDANTYELLHSIEKHEGYVYDLCYFGDVVWSCSWDKKIMVWDPHTYEYKQTLPAFHTDAVSAVIPVWNEIKQRWTAWTGSWDKSVCVWAVKNCSLPVGGIVQSQQNNEITSPSPAPQRPPPCVPPRNPGDVDKPLEPFAPESIVAEPEPESEPEPTPAPVIVEPWTVACVDFENSIIEYDEYVVALYTQHNRYKRVPDMNNRQFENIVDCFSEAARESVQTLCNDPEIYQFASAVPGVVDALKEMVANGVDIRIYFNTNNVSDKLNWIQANFGFDWVPRVLISHDLKPIKADYFISCKNNVEGPWKNITLDKSFNSQSTHPRLNSWKEWNSVITKPV
eukprot:TRINITY_DN5280_c0_g1_i1.p1 TRINITY_DN5280_c0_g1~~TRINITY_DN5280_c0_g1_i1.p1  ORF type:complete len:579 (+),score=121.84 TRINITY_DN5280_c0_g1_i1:82-1737(+)